jgi:hypothetical protein
MTEYNVLDVLLMKKKKYIVLFSGLDFSPVEQITNDLAKDFGAIVLNFIHLSLTDSLDNVNTRVNDLLSKSSSDPKPFFIIGKTFPSDKLKISVDLHLNLSLHPIAIQKLDPLKRPELPQIYTDSIKTNRISRYINLKKEYDISEIENEIFTLIIDDIEKKVYGDQYEKLSSNNKFGSEQSQTQSKSSVQSQSKLSFNPNVPTIQEKKALATTQAEEEIRDSIDSAEDSISAEKDSSDEDFLSDEVRVLGSQGSQSHRHLSKNNY